MDSFHLNELPKHVQQVKYFEMYKQCNVVPSACIPLRGAYIYDYDLIELNCIEGETKRLNQ